MLALRSRIGTKFDGAESPIEPGLRTVSGPLPPKVRLPYSSVHVEQKSDLNDKMARRSESKENSVRREVKSRATNSRKKGQGKKNRGASNNGMQVHAFGEGEGRVSTKV
jgi:hypothetical protein